MDVTPHSTKYSASSGYWLGPCPQIEHVFPFLLQASIKIFKELFLQVRFFHRNIPYYLKFPSLYLHPLQVV